MASLKCTASFIVLLSLMNASFGTPTKMGKFIFGDSDLTERITTTPQTSQQQTAADLPIKFVPLISFFSDFLKFFFMKLGLISAIFNKFPIKSPTRENATQEVMVAELEDEEDDEDNDDSEEETYLLECDANHLGLWPDRSNSQRYYKCEVDPRTPSLGNCVQDYFRERPEAKVNSTSSEGILVPLVRPCFMLTVMKCANGYKYSHKTRICIPDVIFN